MAEETYTLVLRQSATDRWTFALPDPAAAGTYVDMNEWDPYGEIRTTEQDGDLVLSLTALFSVEDGHEDESDLGSDPVPGKWLVLDVPGSATASNTDFPRQNGWFDIFLVLKTDPDVDMLLIEGPVDFNPATTAMAAVEVP